MTKKPTPLKGKEILDGEFYPAAKNKHRVTLIGFLHTKPINRAKIEAFLLKQAKGTVAIYTYRNAIPASPLPNKDI